LVEVDPAVLSLEASSLARALIARPTNGLAMRQDILQSDNSGAVMIADIGAQTTTVSVFSPEAILLISVMIPIAGQHFTDKIADVLKISMAEADHQKKQIGLVDQSNQKTEVPQILKTEIDLLAQEIRKLIDYTEEKLGHHLTKVILAGGTSLLPGIQQYLTDKGKDILFSNVIGLAWRSVQIWPSSFPKTARTLPLFRFTTGDPCAVGTG